MPKIHYINGSNKTSFWKNLMDQLRGFAFFEVTISLKSIRNYTTEGKRKGLAIFGVIRIETET
jgi:hypothetical protein